MSAKIKQAIAALLIAATSAGVGAGLTYTPPAVKCSTARHLIECGECQNVTTQVVVSTVENARKAQAAPVRSGS